LARALACAAIEPAIEKLKLDEKVFRRRE